MLDSSLPSQYDTWRKQPEAVSNNSRLVRCLEFRAYHVTLQILLLLLLKPLEIFHDSHTRILGILLCSLQGLLELRQYQSTIRQTRMFDTYLHQGFARFPYLISPCPLRVYISHALESVTYPTKNLARHEVSTRALFMTTRW